MATENEKLIKGTYETDNTVCGIRKIYKNQNRWSIVVPLLIRQRSIYTSGKNIYVGIDRANDTIFIGQTKEDVIPFVENEYDIQKRTIGSIDNRITIPKDEIENGILDGVVESAIEWHKEYNIMRIRPALPEDIYEARYASRKRREERLNK